VRGEGHIAVSRSFAVGKIGVEQTASLRNRETA